MLRCTGYIIVEMTAIVTVINNNSANVNFYNICTIKDAYKIKKLKLKTTFNVP